MERVQRRSRPEHPVSDAPVQRKADSTVESSGAAGPSSAAGASATGGSWDADAGLMSAMGLDASPVQMEESAAPAADAAVPALQDAGGAASQAGGPDTQQAGGEAGPEQAGAATQPQAGEQGGDAQGGAAQAGAAEACGAEAAPQGDAAAAKGEAQQSGDPAAPGGGQATAGKPGAGSGADEEQAGAEQADAEQADAEQEAAPSESEEPVQGKGMDEDTGGVHAAASEGISGSGGSLPHLDAIQASFGSHDVSGVQAHMDGAAASANQEMGAEAYATGNHVAFGGGVPSLHTAAHEAAHVVQQRGGVQLKGGVGEAGDSWEQHADAVADRVVQGQSAQDLLDPVAGGAGSPSSSGAVQQKAPKAFVPKIKSDSYAIVNLNEDIANTYKITNAKVAPKGTTYSWAIKSSTQSGAFDHTILGGFTTSEAKLSTKSKGSTSGPAQFVIAVTVTPPGGSATTHDAEPFQVEVVEPEYRFATSVVPGPGGGGSGATDLRPFDTLAIRVTYGNVTNPKRYFSMFPGFLPPVSTGTFMNMVSGTPTNHEMPFETMGSKWDGDEVVYSVKTHHAGTGSVLFSAAIPGTKGFTKTFDLQCKSTMADLRARLDLAPHRHEALVSLFDGYLERCFRSYKTAYENAQAALTAMKRREQLTNDILIGILFAGLGGAAGGAIGGVLGNVLKPGVDAAKAAGFIKYALVSARAGAATDAAKDVVKYAVRIFPKLGGGAPAPSAGGAGGGTEWGPDPSSAAGTAGKDVPGVDPHDWISLAREGRDKEVATVKETFLQMKQAADDAIRMGDDRLITNDPVNDITAMTKIEGKLVSEVATLPAPPSEEYEKNMWEGWIGAYGYTAVAGYSYQSAYGGGYSAPKTVDNVGKDLHKEMERVAKELEKKNIDPSWLNTALSAAKAQAQAKAEAETRD